MHALAIRVIKSDRSRKQAASHDRAFIGDSALVLGTIRARLFGIDAGETRFARRGFPACDSAVRDRLERVGASFVAGYHEGLRVADPTALARRVDEAVEASHRGFAYEGAAMALAILDRLTPWNRGRVRRLLEGPGGDHAYMAHVGVGWALARLKRDVDRVIAAMDPLLRWLVWDGFGFHEAYFHTRRVVPGFGDAVGGHADSCGGSEDWSTVDGGRPRRLKPAARNCADGHRGPSHRSEASHSCGDGRGRPCHSTADGHSGPSHCYARRAFDQGVGRCLWFVGGADAERILEMVERFGESRRGDLMSGVGLAAAYAGGGLDGTVERLAALAGSYRSELAQGAAFAAKARVRAGFVPTHTEAACGVLCDMTAEAAARVTDDALVDLDLSDDMSMDDSANAYESWRGRIRVRFVREAVAT